MQNFRTLLYQFYRPLFLWNFIFSCSGIVFLFFNGINFVLMSFFIKLVGYASSVGVQYYFSANQYYYYRNAGYTLRKLYSYAFLADMVIYLIMVYLYSIIMLPLLHA